MILSKRASFRTLIRALIYRTVGGSLLHRVKRLCTPVAIHERPEYWNGELSGRMSEPNLNARISNALRDMSTVVLLGQCGPTPRRVLDVGCGFGDLARALGERGLARYVGVDLSDYVILRNRTMFREADELPRRSMEFHCADLRAFSPAEHDRFEVIVFNEVLKYLEIDECVAELKRYSKWLAPDGVMCVNITGDPKCRAIFRALHQCFPWVYGTVYQQRPDGPLYRLTRNHATPPYLTGIFRPA